MEEYKFEIGDHWEVFGVNEWRWFLPGIDDDSSCALACDIFKFPQLNSLALHVSMSCPVGYCHCRILRRVKEGLQVIGWEATFIGCGAKRQSMGSVYDAQLACCLGIIGSHVLLALVN